MQYVTVFKRYKLLRQTNRAQKKTEQQNMVTFMEFGVGGIYCFNDKLGLLFEETKHANIAIKTAMGVTERIAIEI